MKGRLEDMAVADIIQHNCHSQKAARVELRARRKRAELYFRDGNLVHASLDREKGDEVVYRVLAWEQGNFNVQNDVEPPEISITKSWSSLLLEGVRRLDEDGDPQPEAGGLFGLEDSVDPAPSGADQAIMDGPLDSLDAGMQALSEQTEGFMLAALADLQGRTLASRAEGRLDAERIVEQASHYLKTVARAAGKLGSGDLEDNLLTTEKARMVSRFLADGETFLLLAADKRRANIGSMRHLCDVYAARFGEINPQAHREAA